MILQSYAVNSHEIRPAVADIRIKQDEILIELENILLKVSPK